jgi:hypothetical protein
MESNIETGISLQGFIPLRREPFERSEMVSQVLFGEGMDILDDEGKWLLVRCRFDGYEGWLDAKCVTRISLPRYPPALIAGRNFLVVDRDQHPVLHLPAGSVLPEVENGRFTMAGTLFSIASEALHRKPGEYVLDELIQGVIGVPYVWGGRSGFGFDCSGLTQYLCRALGTDLPRDASDQSALGQTLGFLNEARPGDLAFFDDAEGLIHHVGMIIDTGKILHASGRVRIDRLDQQGIFNTETGTYSHKLRVIKRLTN